MLTGEARMNLRQHAKIGLIHFMAFPEVMKGEGPILETLRRILVDDYFDAVEVTQMKDPAVADEAARMLAQAQVTVAFGVQPVLLINKLNLNALDAAERRKAVGAVKGCFGQATTFDAVGLAVLSGPCRPGKEDEARKALVDSLIELSNEAARHDMKLVLEVFDDLVDKKSLVGKAPVAKAVGEAVRAECANFGLMHDLSHLPLLDESPAEALAPIKHLLIHMHMGNCIKADAAHAGYGDQHPRFGVPGGENDVAELAAFLKTLYDIGYLGGGERRILSFEVKPLPGEDSDLVIANAKRTLNAATAQLEFLQL